MLRKKPDAAQDKKLSLNDVLYAVTVPFKPTSKSKTIDVSLLGTTISSFLNERDFDVLKTTQKSLFGVPILKFSSNYRNIWGKNAYHALYSNYVETHTYSTATTEEVGCATHTNRERIPRYFDNYNANDWQYTHSASVSSFSCFARQPITSKLPSTTFCCWKSCCGNGYEDRYYSCISPDTSPYEHCVPHYVCSTLQAPIRFATTLSFCAPLLICATSLGSCMLCGLIEGLICDGSTIFLASRGLNLCGRSCCVSTLSYDMCSRNQYKVDGKLDNDDWKNLFCVPWLKTNAQAIPCTLAYFAGGIADACCYSSFLVKDCARDKRINNPIPTILSPVLARILFFKSAHTTKPADPEMTREGNADMKRQHP